MLETLPLFQTLEGTSRGGGAMARHPCSGLIGQGFPRLERSELKVTKRNSYTNFPQETLFHSSLAGRVLLRMG